MDSPRCLAWTGPPQADCQKEVEARPSGDRAVRLLIEDLQRHPERLDLLVSEIARHKSVLYG